MKSTTVLEPENGETSEIECQEPTETMRSKERAKPGNLKGRSLAVRREQKMGPLDQEEERPLVWSEWRCVRK